MLQLIKRNSIITVKSSRRSRERLLEEQEKRVKTLRTFNTEIAKRATENERRAAKSIEYARHAIAR